MNKHRALIINLIWVVSISQTRLAVILTWVRSTCEKTFLTFFQTLLSRCRSFLLGESIRDHCCSWGNCNQNLRWNSLGANAYDVQSEQLFALTCKRRVRYSLLKKVYEIPRSRWFAQRIFRFGGVWSTDLSFNQSPASCFCGSAHGRHVFLPTCCQAFTTIFQMLFVHGYGTKLTPWISNALLSLFAAKESVR